MNHCRLHSIALDHLYATTDRARTSWRLPSRDEPTQRICEIPAVCAHAIRSQVATLSKMEHGMVQANAREQDYAKYYLKAGPVGGSGTWSNVY